MKEGIPMRHFFLLLGLIALAELLLMVTVDPMMEAYGYPVWIRAMADAGLLALICFPFVLNLQLRPMQMAYHDPLTGLPNRQLFNDRLAHALVVAKREQSSFAVVFLDLDNFKPINDRFGHRVGDVVLKLAAVRIESGMRESDTVARIGGDEFIIILTDTNLDESFLEMKLIENAFSSNSAVASISYGIVLFNESELNHEFDLTNLVNKADELMYIEKKHSKNF